MLRLISTLAALGRELQEVLSVPQDLPDSIARALARLESSTKINPPDGVIDERRCEDIADRKTGDPADGRFPV
jgi:hypothetical protein